MDWAVAKPVIVMLALPPAGPLALALFGLLLALIAGARWAWLRGAARAMVVLGVALAWITSCGIFSGPLIAWLESENPVALDPDRLRDEMRGRDPPGAIVVLGGGVRVNVAERPRHQTPNAFTLERLAQGVLLARASGLPILVTGGRPPRTEESEARTMARTLETHFGARARWVEERAADTAGNANETARLLKAAGIRRVVLVTHAYHMRRARPVFEAAGLSVIAAPHGYGGSTDAAVFTDFVPTSTSIQWSWLGVHEAVGLLWYRAQRLM